METENLKNKIGIKKGVTILNIIVITLIGILIFGAFLSFTTDNAIQANVTVPDRYEDSYQRLLSTQNNLSDNVDEIKESISGLTEPDNAVQVAFNGIKGVLALFKLPLKIISPVLLGAALIMDMVDFIPSQVVTTIGIILGVIIVFALLRFVTQRGNDA